MEMQKSQKFWFLVSLALLCASVLMAQIAFTRLLSILFFYHLAFLSISMAMLGLTGGAIAVYVLEKRLGPLDLGIWLPRACLAFGLGIFIALTFMTANRVNGFFSLVLMLCGVVLPYLAAGLAVSLALTRSPCKLGLTYAADLFGAAAGCLGALVLLDLLLPIQAILVIGMMGLVAAFGFSMAIPRKSGSVIRNALVALLFVFFLQSDLPLFAITTDKDRNLFTKSEFTDGNAYSYIKLSAPVVDDFYYWGPAADAPLSPIEYRFMNIDGLAGTPMYSHDKLGPRLDDLKYDVTNLAYTIRHSGKSAVIGVGGGRDLIAARHFGFSDVTGVELNPIMVRLLTTEPFASYAGIGLDPAVHLFVDDGRSWFARTTQKFSLLQMSMVDTWAATGAGNFTLSENGLYTLEGWLHFINALEPDGVFTVSRWYNPNNIDETGRMIALAMATLQKLDMTEPRRHIYVGATENLATLIVSKAPFSPADLARLDAESTARGYRVLLHPDRPAATPILEAIVGARDSNDLYRATSSQLLNLTPTDDNRPFFFNQMKLSTVFSFHDLKLVNGGVLSGNIMATNSVMIIIFVSFILVIGLLVLPAAGSLVNVSTALAWPGSCYFMLIGMGFMFVEMGMIQRMSIFLGHPIYGLAIVLFSLILATGLGSLASDRVPQGRERLTGWIVALVALIVLVALAGPILTHRFESSQLPVRALIAILHVAPAAFLMGFAFPFGLRLTMRVDPRPAPWFWGMNGAAGVLGSSLAVIVSISGSITITLLVGAAFYALLLWPAHRLRRLPAAA